MATPSATPLSISSDLDMKNILIGATVRSLMYVALCTVLGLASLFPFAWMLRSSLMSNLEIYQYPPVPLPVKWRWDNFSYAVTLLPFGRYLVNTLIITIPSVVGVLLTSTMAAYAFARLEFAGKKFWFSDA